MASLKQMIRTPPSYGGLMRYFDDYSSKIRLRPDQVLVLSAIVIIAVIALHILL